jgi:hypothetical protein
VLGSGMFHRGGTLRKRIVIPALVLIWLIIGAIAAGQRGYYSNSDPDLCLDRNHPGDDLRRAAELRRRQLGVRLPRRAATVRVGRNRPGIGGGCLAPADRGVR